METFVFVGSDKNAGKTTAFNFVYRSLVATSPGVVLTSIGINGESVDAFAGRPKPRILVKAKTHFLTAAPHLNQLSGAIAVQKVFAGPPWSQVFVLATALVDLFVVLEGPNSRDELLELKRELALTGAFGHLLIDGSIDRQFLAHHEVADGIFLAYHEPRRRGLRARRAELLLRLPECGSSHRQLIDSYRARRLRLPQLPALGSALLKSDGTLLYESAQSAVFDRGLIAAIESAVRTDPGQELVCYLTGALTASMAAELRGRVVVVLESPTQVQGDLSLDLLGNVFVSQKPRLRAVFVKQEGQDEPPELPPLDCPVINLHRGGGHDVRI